jgi:hypothetical protein
MKKEGDYEPLVLVPNRLGGAIVIVVNYADATHIRLGYFQTGLVHQFTSLIDTDYAKAHVLTVNLGAILPPYTDVNAYRGWPKNMIEASRQWVILSWDGKEVFRYALDFGDRENWYRPVIGSNQIIGGISESSFSGVILSQRREPLTPPSI